MHTPEHATRRASALAMLAAGLITAQVVGGKATRDALFLTSMDFTSLPAMLVATSICSVVLVAVQGWVSARHVPRALVPAMFLGSSALLVGEWLARPRFPAAVSTVIYLHISTFGPLLMSGFWLIAGERFDVRTARRRYSQIAAAGTLGGLAGALVAARVGSGLGSPAMLPVLALIQALAAAVVRLVALQPAGTPEPARAAARSALRLVTATPHLRRLATMVVLGTAGGTLLDYLFKAHAVQTFGRGDSLLRFFALYYGASSLAIFVVQAVVSRRALHRLGPAGVAASPSVAVLAGGAGVLLTPSFGALALARAGESIVRGSLFRSGYEVLFAPLRAADKRAVRSFLDVACERAGDALGGGFLRLSLLLFPFAQTKAIVCISLVCAVGSMAAARRLGRGYLGVVSDHLVDQARSLGRGDDHTVGPTQALIRSVMLRNRIEPPPPSAAAVVDDPQVQDIIDLRSRDRVRIGAVLSREIGLGPALIPHVIPLLAWEAVADQAFFALRKVAEEHVGELVDALLDPEHDVIVRRRLARVFSVCVSARAADGVLIALDDPRFDVRCQAARSLTAILDKNPRIRLDASRLFAVVLREVQVGRPVWESRRLLDEGDAEPPLDAFVRRRAGESMTHVFTLLSLVLPAEPVRIAFRSLHAEDVHLRGAALEFLEGVLPPEVRSALWPYLERESTRPAPGMPPAAIADLLRSNESVALNLEELRRRLSQVTAPAR